MYLGELYLEFDDDGKSYGPVWAGGNIGIRFMAHSVSAKVHSLKVYQLSAK